MLKYYSYYNVGGYKDMFLGDSSMNVQATYYLPLLPIWKKKADSGEKKYAERIKGLEELPKIQVLNASVDFGLPKDAETIFSHGGYKVLCISTTKGETLFAIRDVEGNSKDETGRSIPFLMAIVGNTQEDKNTLEVLTAYVASHLGSFSKTLAGMFQYDADRNGVAFNLSALTNLIREIVKKHDNTFLTINDRIHVHSNEAALLLLPEGITKQLALQEQKLSGKKVCTVGIECILPFDNQKRLISILQKAQGSKQSVLSDKRILYILGGAVALGFVVGLFIGKSYGG